MRSRLWLSFFALLLIAVGCRGDKQFIGGKKAPVVYSGVVSLSPGCSEIAATTFARIVVGRTASCNSPGQIMGAPIVMKGVKPDYEKIAKLKPDAVIYDVDLFSKSDIDKFKELGIPTVGIGGDTVEAFIDSLYEFGRYTNAVELGAAYVDKILREREGARGAAPQPPVTTALIIPGSNAEHMIAGVDSFSADVVRSGGAKAVGPPGRLFMTLNAEWLMKANPELIMTAGPAGPFLNDPRFKNLRAVKNGNVYGTNADITLRRGAYVDRFIKRVGQLVNVVRKGTEEQG